MTSSKNITFPARPVAYRAASTFEQETRDLCGDKKVVMCTQRWHDGFLYLVIMKATRAHARTHAEYTYTNISITRYY